MDEIDTMPAIEEESFADDERESKRQRRLNAELKRYQKQDEKTIPRSEWARRDAEVFELKKLYPRLPEFYLLLAWNMHYRMGAADLEKLLEQCDAEERNNNSM